MSIQFDGVNDLENEVYGLYEQGQKVGQIKVRLDMCTIMDIFIKPDLRRQGRGTKLVRFIEALAFQKGCKKVRVKAIKNTPEAKGLFVSCGYHLYPNKYGEYDGKRTLRRGE